MLRGRADSIWRPGGALCPGALSWPRAAPGDATEEPRLATEAEACLVDALRDEWGAGDAFQALELVGGALQGVSGPVRYAPQSADLED